MNPQQIPTQQSVPPALSPEPVASPTALPMASTPPQPGINSAPPKTRNPNSTQNNLLIAEIRDGMLIMNDGSFRAVVSCESINFDLMSSREREGVEYSYQSFLNSLYFPIQIFIRSQRIDIGPYLERLVKQRRSQDNMLLGVLMEDYIRFIDDLSRETNIMDKQFYVVVPYFSSGDLTALANVSKSIFASFTKQQEQQRVKIDENTYNKAKDELSNRINATVSGLYQIGVKTKSLNTQQLSELYYNVYNPDTAVHQSIGDTEAHTGTYVQKAQGQPSATPGGF